MIIPECSFQSDHFRFFATDSSRKFNLESKSVLKIEKWFDFDYFSENKQKKLLKILKISDLIIRFEFKICIFSFNKD